MMPDLTDLTDLLAFAFVGMRYLFLKKICGYKTCHKRENISEKQIFKTLV